jgi:hypothetical protein
MNCIDRSTRRPRLSGKGAHSTIFEGNCPRCPEGLITISMFVNHTEGDTRIRVVIWKEKRI